MKWNWKMKKSNIKTEPMDNQTVIWIGEILIVSSNPMNGCVLI